MLKLLVLPLLPSQAQLIKLLQVQERKIFLPTGRGHFHYQTWLSFQVMPHQLYSQLPTLLQLFTKVQVWLLAIPQQVNFSGLMVCSPVGQTLIREVEVLTLSLTPQQAYSPLPQTLSSGLAPLPPPH